ncbi:MAG: permease [Bacilli bacterium]|jgi:putative transport protein
MYQFLVAAPILVIFMIALLGYAFGRISIKGLSLGTGAVLLVALVFGHFFHQYSVINSVTPFSMPSIVQEMGLVLFVTSVGFIAGPRFFKNFKGHAVSYLILGVAIVLVGVLTCAGIILITKLDTDLAVGLLAGALTTTPGLAVVNEVTGTATASIGYGIAYPFGVIGVVLFVQLAPRIFKTDMQKEREQFAKAEVASTVEKKKKILQIDPQGFFGFALAVVLGVLLGKIEIPFANGVTFSLGTSGGPLIAGLLLGHFGTVARVNVTMNKETLKALRELGLTLFLIGAGFKAGAGFVDVLVQYGAMLFVYGVIMTIIPMIVGLFLARKVLKLGMLNSLGSICGGMTSTPALGALIKTAETDDVATSYAATYPIAIAVIVITFQVLCLIF